MSPILSVKQVWCQYTLIGRLKTTTKTNNKLSTVLNKLFHVSTNQTKKKCSKETDQNMKKLETNWPNLSYKIEWVNIIEWLCKCHRVEYFNWKFFQSEKMDSNIKINKLNLIIPDDKSTMLIKMMMATTAAAKENKFINLMKFYFLWNKFWLIDWLIRFINTDTEIWNFFLWDSLSYDWWSHSH